MQQTFAVLGRNWLSAEVEEGGAKLLFIYFGFWIIIILAGCQDKVPLVVICLQFIELLSNNWLFSFLTPETKDFLGDEDVVY